MQATKEYQELERWSSMQIYQVISRNIFVHTYTFITTINEKDKKNLKRTKRAIWEGLEGG